MSSSEYTPIRTNRAGSIFGVHDTQYRDPNARWISGRALLVMVTAATAVIVISALVLSLTADRRPHVDVLVTGAQIWTANTENGKVVRAESFAVKDGRIIFVGTESEALEKYRVKHTRDGRVEGFKMVTPGFTDSHIHLIDGGFSLNSVDLFYTNTTQGFVDKIGEFANKAKNGEWILNGNWNNALWGGMLPNKTWIDSVTLQNPVFLSRLDGHMALANSYAMKIANITKDTKDVKGGVIDRDQNGEPTGIFRDNAISLIDSVIPEYTDEQMGKALNAAMSHLNSFGVTSAHHMGTWDHLDVFDDFNKTGDLTIRIHASVPIGTWSKLADRIKKSGRGEGKLTIGSLKGFADGSFGSETALMFDPYLVANGLPGNNTGLSVDAPGFLMNMSLGADKAGIQICIHAIGDKANDIVLNITEACEQQNGQRDRRFRIEHSQDVIVEDIKRFASYQVIASMQPYHLRDDGGWLESKVGQNRSKRMFPFREMIDHNITLTFGSDWPVAPTSPIAGIYAAVTRRTNDGKHPDGWIPEQKITVEESLFAFTSHPAYAIYQESDRGKISVGMVADFVFLSEDLTAVQPENIEQVKVVETFLAGKSVYKST